MATQNTADFLNQLIEAQHATPATIGEGNEALLAASQEIVKQHTDRTKGEYVGMLNNFSTELKSRVQASRRAKNTARTAAASVKEMDRAFRYFAATGNPFPCFALLGQSGSALDLCDRLNIEYPDADSGAYDIPADWDTPAS
jgi:hypothetical protein